MAHRPRSHLASLLLTLAVTAASLRVLDAVPRAVTGLPRGVIRLTSLDDAARRLGFGVPTPSVVPDDVDWPPRDILVGAHSSVTMTSRHRPDGPAWLIVAGAPARAGAIDPAVLPAVTVLQDTELVLGDGRTMTIQRQLDSSGALWHQASWREHARLLLVRSRGSLDELLRIAQSVRERNRHER
jgi:hypothetical protein